MLHITNGDAAAGLIRDARLGGQVVCWNDLLHEGPVPAVPADELRAIRARFLADCRWASYESALMQLERRDSRVAQSNDQILLWFEDDLVDQLQLIQALDALDGRPAGLIMVDARLGSLTVFKVRTLMPQAAPVTAAQYELAKRAWAAFRAPDPMGMQELVQGETSALEYLADALNRLLQQYPSARDGLARSERQVLQVVASGAKDRKDAFVRDQKMEHPEFMSDAAFQLYIDRLLKCRVPLLSEEAGRLALTEAGREMLLGRTDYVKLNGLDRWLGGVQLSGESCRWRWDEGTRRLRPAP
jgi:hypothetical protein